eukprot:1123671-Amorphochlora_amoeboformis.AAC.1
MIFHRFMRLTELGTRQFHRFMRLTELGTRQFHRFMRLRELVIRRFRGSRLRGRMRFLDFETVQKASDAEASCIFA